MLRAPHFIKKLATIELKNPTLLQTDAVINNQYISTQNKFSVKNPATNENLTTDISNCSIHDYENAINFAKESFKTWKRTSGRQRSDILQKVYTLMMENSEDLAKIVTLENGKLYKESLGEIKYAASFFQWFAEEAPRINGQIFPSANADNRILTIKQPLGVCAILTPWNFPAAMITRKLGAALATGNVSIIKPASETPLTALAIMQILIDAGVPKGVVNMLPTSYSNTPEVGKFLCEHGSVRKISFTGSTRVGQLLSVEAAASNLKKTSMELGGNAPFIIFDDTSNIDAAVEGIIASKFRQSGQTCICANRIFIHESLYDTVSAKLTERVRKFKVGDGLSDDPSITNGPLISQRAVDKVSFLVNDAVDKSAKVLTGGSHIKGNFYEPTILGEVTPDMKIFQEEIFGPVASLVKFSTEEEVIRMANSLPVGLAGYFFSDNASRIFRVAEELQVGMVGVNTGSISEASMAFGGVKESGNGREGSVLGVNDWLDVKTIVLNINN